MLHKLQNLSNYWLINYFYFLDNRRVIHYCTQTKISMQYYWNHCEKSMFIDILSNWLVLFKIITKRLQYFIRFLVNVLSKISHIYFIFTSSKDLRTKISVFTLKNPKFIKILAIWTFCQPYFVFTNVIALEFHIDKI